MDGAIVTNGFLRTEKLEEPVRMMMSSAERMGIGLRAFTNSDLAVPIGDREALEEVIGEPDFIVFWDKDVRCAANLELCGFRVLNTSECIRICDDKSLTHLILSKDGVPSIPSTVVPMTFDGIGYGDMGFVDVLEGSHGYPMVVKDCFGSFGMQVHLIRDRNSLCSILDEPRPMIVQDYVECYGTDVRLEVVGGEVVAAMKRTAPNGEFRANATLGGTIESHSPSDDETELAIAASESVGADFCGVDIIRRDGEPLVCEVNSNAHLRNLEECTGVDASRSILEHIMRTQR